MTSDDKIAILEGFDEVQKFNHAHFATIADFSFAEDGYVRSKCAELLINFKTNESKELLIKLACDNNDLVRTEAYDSLGSFPTNNVEEFLSGAIKIEKDHLARCYAILSWTDVAVALQHNSLRQIKELEENKIQENSQHCALSYCYALYLFGKKEVLAELLSYLDNDDYHIRCIVISILSSIIDESNKDLIRGSVKKLYTTEDCIAVRDRLESFLWNC